MSWHVSCRPYRLWALALVVSLPVRSLVWAAEPTSPETVVVGAERPSPRRVEIEETLREETEISVNDMPLRDFCDFLAENHHLPILIDRKSLEDEGVDPDSPVSLNVRGITIRSALSIGLKPLALSWVIEDGMLKITSQSYAESVTEIRLYPIRDLLVAEDTVDGLSGGAATSLVSTIETVVMPDSWESRGGIGVMTYQRVGSVLVCRNTRAAHERVEELLRGLRTAAQAKPAEAAASAVELRVYRLPIGGEQVENWHEELSKAITKTVAPESWQEKGGQGSIHSIVGALFVRQSSSVHDQVRSVIEALAPPASAHGGKGGAQLENAKGGGGGYFSD